ncbi:uncharacterized protein LOC122797729 [Protopterus annectens]|uniref:uncharacterized protein LOC122797729 n=1 Tax=Protopterus annectens TaxID=7888 RepID=UPI001CFA8FA1|nr:uncharacterized protein LOC122797729 [Protopterus annectens]
MQQLMIQDPANQYIYFLPKIHKNPLHPPGRPIVSAAEKRVSNGRFHVRRLARMQEACVNNMPARCRPPFSEAENDNIIEALLQHHAVLMSRSWTNISKCAALWDKLVQNLNAIGRHNHSYEQVRHRTMDMIHAARKHAVEVAPDHQVTGGGPAAEQPLTTNEEFLANIATSDSPQQSISQYILDGGATPASQEELPGSLRCCEIRHLRHVLIRPDKPADGNWLTLRFMNSYAGTGFERRTRGQLFAGNEDWAWKHRSK